MGTLLSAGPRRMQDIRHDITGNCKLIVLLPHFEWLNIWFRCVVDMGFTATFSHTFWHC